MDSTWLIVDVETTGTDPARDTLIEVGAVVYAPREAAIVRCESWLCHADSNEAEAVNGIPARLLASHGVGSSWALERVEAMTAASSYVLAHSASFDRQWLPTLSERRWLCTFEDAEWPRVPTGTGSLTSIALAYGVGVVRAHRAIDDCLTLASVLTRVAEYEGGLDAWLARATEPRREMIAQVSFHENQLAKDAGFRWDAERRVWKRSVRESQLDALRDVWPFKTRDSRCSACPLEATQCVDGDWLCSKCAAESRRLQRQANGGVNG